MAGSIVLFLENHGLFVSAINKESCIKLHENIINKLRDSFNYSNLDAYGDIKANGFLTPDHVVYSSLDMTKLSEKQKIAFDELEQYTKIVISLINSKKWNVKYLTTDEVFFIQNMEEEKYRQKLLGKKE